MPGPIFCLSALLLVFARASGQSLAPGIIFEEVRRQAVETDSFLPGGPQVIYRLQIDPRQGTLRLGQAMDEVVGAETTSSMSRRAGALAAINGGYFRTTGVARGEPVGLLVKDGRVLSEPVRNRASLLIGPGDSQRLAIVFPRLSLTLRIGKSRLPVDGINRPRQADELVVYTPDYHRTTLTEPGGSELVVRQGRRPEPLSAGQDKASRVIPPDGMVISAHGKARERLAAIWRTDRPVRLQTDLQTGEPGSLPLPILLGAGPQLLRQGAVVLEEQVESYAPSFLTDRAPRTAIGWQSDGTILLVVVDGRQPQWSIGMTLAELAELMRDFGCQEALNLDGGGSTTMVVQDRVVNRPSDATSERPVSDAILLFPSRGRTP